jgi:Na+-driven multidrug efflux pump
MKAIRGFFRDASWLWLLLAFVSGAVAILAIFQSTGDVAKISIYSAFSQAVVGIAIIFFTARSVVLAEKQMWISVNQDL